MAPTPEPGLLELLGRLYRPHPWHGLSPGPEAPQRVTVFVEIVPTDTVKYEIDKESGFLKIDRPQRYSNVCPAIYGFIPRTYCGPRVAELCATATGRDGVSGDGDPLDICVLAEHALPRGDVTLSAIPVGGLRMIDRQQADDKILAVLEGDAVYGGLTDLAEVPGALVDRLRHYFLTYKQGPDAPGAVIEIPQVYGRAEAHEVIERSRQDYTDKFGHLPDPLQGLWPGAPR